METEEASDQLPEEGAESYTPDDDKSGTSGERGNPGGDDSGDSDAGDATGNPANAG